MNRRQMMLSLMGSAVYARATNSRMSVEGYIFVQYAERQKKPLIDVLDECLGMAADAGFHNIELSDGFFAPEFRDRALSLVRAHHLRMPSVYVGGGMHTAEMAQKTREHALETAKLCQPFGCVAVVNNPSPKSNAEKTDDELAIQARELNALGRALKDSGFELRTHNHTPELVNNAREWRHILHNTDPELVFTCLDLDWVHQGGFKPLDLLKEAAARVHEVHVRNSKAKLWLEDLEDGDVDYREIARYFDEAKLRPLVIVELAYREKTPVTRPLGEDLRLSRVYAEKVFNLRA